MGRASLSRNCADPRRVPCGIQNPIIVRFGKPAVHDSELPWRRASMARAMPARQVRWHI